MAMFLLLFSFQHYARFFNKNDLNNFHVYIFYLNRHLLPFRQADLTASASLQGIRSERPRLPVLCLASTATSTRE